MLVSEIIAYAASNLGRDDLLSEIKTANKNETNEELLALLRAYNLVENELALDYFPLKKTIRRIATSGRVSYTDFSEAPVNILSVTQEGKPIACTFDSLGYDLPAGVTGYYDVEYTYQPSPKEYGTDAELAKGVSARLASFGVACEYCLMFKRFDEAAVWERKYRDALRAIGMLRRTLAMRSRRWV